MSRSGTPRWEDCRGAVLTIEGGGTQTNAQLFQPGATTPCATGKSGTCNPSTNFDASVRSVTEVWEQVGQATGLAAAEVSVCMGCAGLVPADVRARFVAALAPLGFATVVPLSDGYAALVGAGGGAACGMVVAGTGCAGHRMRPDGTSFQRDGWGFIGGDRGSGAWLGHRSLRYAMEARDGLKPMDALAQAHLDDLGGETAKVAAWFTTCEPRDIAAQALHVFDHAAAGLARAEDLLQAAAAELRALFASLECAPDEPLFIAGSIAEALEGRIATGMPVRPTRPGQRAQEGCRLVATGSAPVEWPDG